MNVQNIMKKYEHLSFEKAVTVSENESDSDTDDMEDATPCIPTADEEIIANLKVHLEVCYVSVQLKYFFAGCRIIILFL